MSGHVLLLASLSTAIATFAFADESPTAPPDKPQWQRLLDGSDAAKAIDLQQRIGAAEQADHYNESIELHEQLLKLRTAAQGVDHWETANEHVALNVARKIAALSVEERGHWRKALRGSVDARQLRDKGQYASAQPLLEEYSRWCEKVLGEKHPDSAASYTNVAINLNRQAKYADAQPLFQKALDLNRELLGENHPETANSYNNLAQNLNGQGRYADARALLQKALDLRIGLFGERHPLTANSYNNLAVNLDDQGKHVEAQPMHEKALDLNRELLSEKHPLTVNSYNNLAVNLDDQGKYAQAQPMHEKALDLNRELFGEKHPLTATSYNNLAMNLNRQGRYADAQPLLQKALDLRLELLGEKHPDSASAYNNLALNLNAQCKYAKALPVFLKALDLNRELLGEKHPATINSYANLAANLGDEGKYADAQPLLEKALGLNIELLGETHPLTAASYNNLAMNQNRQGKYADAQPLLQKALDLRLGLLGEKHPDTANSYNSLAANLSCQRKYPDAQPLYQKALDLNRQLLGEKHPATAQVYVNLAANLNCQGKYAEAQTLHQKALQIRLELLGEKHPETAISLESLALNLLAEGNYAGAQSLLIGAVEGYEAARLTVVDSTLDRAVFGINYSPYRLLAITQALLSAPAEAWLAAESDLSRGLLDEAGSRHSVALTTDEQERKITLTGRLNQLQPPILQLVTKQSPSDDDKRELANLHAERRELEAELAELGANLSKRELAGLAQIQVALPVDAALIVWIDFSDHSAMVQEHWACTIRSSGGSIWKRMSGSAPDGNWTSADDDLPSRLSAVAAGNGSPKEVTKLSAELYAQRIAPLETHLDGVKRLFVVPVNQMVGVPMEVVTDKYTISYVPSGTLLARLKDRPPPGGEKFLALGDPMYPPIKPRKELPLPPGGLLITHVLPGGNAAQARIQPGDVLLEYAGAEPASIEQLGKLIEEHAEDKSIVVTAWRDAKTTRRDLPPGKLGVVLDRRPAPEAIVAKRETDKMLLAIARGGEWTELPGSALEVNRIKALAGDGQATVLTGSAASEQELERLRTSRELEKFRYLHFATHGEPNNARSFESALILSQDQITGEIPPAGEKYYDGRLTANEVLENWKLNADLVTLSACESALGRPGGGDGLLGFAQAFLLAGARSVCLSLWKVDDTATALLMDRFYQNLLGKRAGLEQPMAKAAALAEAKRWLRELSLDEATQLAAKMASGVSRGKNEPALNLVVPTTKPAAENHDETRPFSHPRYWAAFILIGDPD